MTISTDLQNTQVPVELDINDSSTGVVTGASPVVSVRKGDSAEYLDFSDSTFKASGWVQKTQVLTEANPGFYYLPGGLDLTALVGLGSSTSLVQEFEATRLGRTYGCHRVVITNELCAKIATLEAHLERARKFCENARTVDFSVTPRQLVVYDDDNVTEIYRADMFTLGGEPVTTQTGVQVRLGPNLIP